MTTAYMVHTMEGVPQRRIISSKLMGENMEVVVSTCSMTWEVQGPQYLKSVAINAYRRSWSQFSTDPEVVYHKKLRAQLVHQYGHRLEFYYPITDPL